MKQTEEERDQFDQLYIAAITGPDIQNGTGIRLTVWVQGCTNNCPGCHNEWLQSYDKEGKHTRDEVLPYIRKELERKDSDGNYIYDGVTLSGGDPLCQSYMALKSLVGLIYDIKCIRADINIWMYTGLTFDYIKSKPLLYNIIKYIDVLVDGRFMEKYKINDIEALPFRGSSNQHIIDVKKSIETNSVVELEIV